MSDSAPAPEAAPAASEPAAAESLLDAAPEGGSDPAPKPSEAGKPADDAKPAEGAEASSPASLLDDDDEGATPVPVDGPADADKGEPEAYSPFDLPEGMTFNEGALTEAKALFQKNGLKQEGAQELVTLAAKLARETGENIFAEQQKAQTEMIAEWTKATKESAEFGKDNLKVSRGLVNKAIETFGGDAKDQAELKNMLRETGLGNHPLIYGLLYRAAAATSQDTLVTGATTTPAKELSVVERMWPQYQNKE